MKKIIQIKSDDPKKRQFNLIVTGPVEKVVDIEPASVYLDGKAGDILEGVVRITPSEKFSFSIVEMRQHFNTGIKAELIQPEKNQKSYQLKIHSRSDEPTDLYDVIYLKTDSKLRPTLTIRVYAVFFKPVVKQEKKNS